LDFDVAGVVLDVEGCLRGIRDAPDHDGGDLHRVAALVIDLDGIAAEVVRAQGQLGADELE
jgi:hypothetical protein